mgnify:CR=1 FL=1
MDQSQDYVIHSLEQHLFFARIMKEHALFLKLGFLPPNQNLAQDAEHFLREFEALLSRAIAFSNRVVRNCVLCSGELVTEFTDCAERQTQQLTGTAIDRKLTARTIELVGCGSKADPPVSQALVRQVRQLNRDGIQLVRELKELGSRAKFVMISQVSAKELIAKAYQAGVEFFIQKPINLIEVRQVVGNVIRQMENERALHTIQSVFQSRESQPAAPAGRQEVWRRRIQYILSQLGMAGEKGAGDIMELCLFLLERKQTASQIGVGTLCSQLSDSPKTMEQRVRRAVERGLGHIASLGVEDYGNEFFTQYAAVLFPFPEVRAEMAHLRGKGGRGKVNLKKFLDGMLILTEEY